MFLQILTQNLLQNKETMCSSNLLYYDDSRRKIYRQDVPNNKKNWNITWFEYKPECFTLSKILSNPPPEWADPKDIKLIQKWNQIDGTVNRRSEEGEYKLDLNGYPLNPCGRTGLCGRGSLGKWGPNHAADPIVTRWKMSNANKFLKNPKTDKKILQFVAIKRNDTGQWAIPGGMIDNNEKVSETLRREFMEEAMNSLENKQEASEKLDSFFSNGVEIYRGYVDDPRNTDNAWMETVAFNFHDENGTLCQNIELCAGDDAGSVKWMDIDERMNLYANHKMLLETTAKIHDAHW